MSPNLPRILDLRRFDVRLEIISNGTLQGRRISTISWSAPGRSRSRSTERPADLQRIRIPADSTP
jgi:hypothetical protein